MREGKARNRCKFKRMQNMEMLTCFSQNTGIYIILTVNLANL